MDYGVAYEKGNSRPRTNDGILVENSDDEKGTAEEGKEFRHRQKYGWPKVRFIGTHEGEEGQKLGLVLKHTFHLFPSIKGYPGHPGGKLQPSGVVGGSRRH